MKTLIVYFSKYGQTQAIAQRIKSVIAAADGTVEILDATQALAIRSLAEYDAIILGSPIYVSRHSKILGRFIKKHLESLNQKQTAFFSVSLSAAGDTTQQKDATDCMNRFLKSCNWRPATTMVFAGAVPYRKYNWLIRWMMKQIVRKAGGDTDTSRNYEYTDWSDVEQFGRQFIDAEDESPSGIERQMRIAQ